MNIYSFKSFQKRKTLIKEGLKNGIPEVGDYVKVINVDKKKINDNHFALDYIKLNQLYKILDVRIKENGKYLIDIGCRNPDNNDEYFYNFTRFQLVEPPIIYDENHVYIQMSDKFIKYLKKVNDNIIKNFMLNLPRGIKKEYVRDIYLNYLDVNEDDKGMITSLRSDEVGGVVDINNVWSSNRRKSSTILKVLRRILTDEYLQFMEKTEGWNTRPEGHGKKTPYDTFAENWKILFDTELSYEILKNEDILKAYNFTGTYKGVEYVSIFNPTMVEASCANFNNKNWNTHNKPEEYEFYIQNPDVIGLLVVKQGGLICGRVVIYEGDNLFDTERAHIGQHYKIYGNIYVASDNNAKYRAGLEKWLNENGYKSIDNLNCGVFFNVQTGVSDRYTAIDQIYVNLNDDIMCTRHPYNTPGEWYSAYRLDVKSKMEY